MPVALVTGASRGVGRGVAASLAAAGYTVFGTGRTIAAASLPDSIIRISCDHLDDAQTTDAVARALEPCGTIDVLVNISFWPAQKHIGNVPYRIAKAATDTMTRDMAAELRSFGVSVVSLYPGLVRTEAVLAAAKGGWLDLTNSESPEFIGRVRSPGLPAHPISNRIPDRLSSLRRSLSGMASSPSTADSRNR